MKNLILILCLCVLLSYGCASTTRLYRIKVEESDRGAKIVEKKVEVIAEKETIEESPNVKTVRRITDFQGKKNVGLLDISPDGKRIVFQVREKDGYWNLWLVNTTGGRELTRLTVGKSRDLQPKWSQDGDRIYFSSDRVGKLPHLWSIKSIGAGGLTQITSSLSADYFPDVSPDGANIAYTSFSHASVAPQIWVISTTGTLPTQIRVGDMPKWSPDGSKILYVKKDDETGEQHIWVMSADGTDQTQLTFGEPREKEVQDVYPDWSPDGKKIVFASDRGRDRSKRRNFDIWIINSDGGELTQLTTNGSHDTGPVWASDGKHIYFLSNRGVSWDIWVMEPITG